MEQLQTNPDQDKYETSQQMVKQHIAGRRVTCRKSKKRLD